MAHPFAAALVLLCSIGIAAGCAGSNNAVCTADRECDSGFCRADGTCAPETEPDAGGTASDAAGSDAPPTGLCTPDHDGMVTQAELPLIAGRMATFRVAANPTFATAGTALPNNQRRWDLAGQLDGDADRAIALGAPTGTWWEAAFPGATYAAPLASGSDLLGVFKVSATAVALLGVVSPEAGATRTELVYDPPATILALPITAGASWSSTSSVTGVALGVFALYTERYTSVVDQLGTMATPYGEFPVVRVATDLARTSGVATLLTQRTFAWVSECYGAVANASSQTFETETEFTDPAEVRRLAP